MVAGQGVQWAASTKDEFLVTYPTDTTPASCSGAQTKRVTSSRRCREPPFYRFATCGAGGWHISTRSYERYTYASRTGGGPLVPISYNASDRLVFSLRGYWTKEDEWTLSGDPRGSNSYYIGFVTQVPSAATEFYMGIQVSI